MGGVYFRLWGIVQTSALESPGTWLDTVVRSRAVDSIARRLPGERLRSSGGEGMPPLEILDIQWLTAKFIVKHRRSVIKASVSMT